jgi:hypothetical protein
MKVFRWTLRQYRPGCARLQPINATTNAAVATEFATENQMTEIKRSGSAGEIMEKTADFRGME